MIGQDTKHTEKAHIALTKTVYELKQRQKFTSYRTSHYMIAQGSIATIIDS